MEARLEANHTRMGATMKQKCIIHCCQGKPRIIRTNKWINPLAVREILEVDLKAIFHLFSWSDQIIVTPLNQGSKIQAVSRKHSESICNDFIICMFAGKERDWENTMMSLTSYDMAMTVLSQLRFPDNKIYELHELLEGK